MTALFAAWQFLVGTQAGRFILGACALVLALFIFGRWEHHNGYAECKAEWAQAEKRAIDLGSDARRDAERDAGRVPDRYDRNDN